MLHRQSSDEAAAARPTLFAGQGWNACTGPLPSLKTPAGTGSHPAAAVPLYPALHRQSASRRTAPSCRVPLSGGQAAQSWLPTMPGLHSQKVWFSAACAPAWHGRHALLARAALNVSPRQGEQSITCGWYSYAGRHRHSLTSALPAARVELNAGHCEQLLPTPRASLYVASGHGTHWSGELCLYIPSGHVQPPAPAAGTKPALQTHSDTLLAAVTTVLANGGHSVHASCPSAS
eukprot:1052448-Rhodomonas_salina.1